MMVKIYKILVILFLVAGLMAGIAWSYFGIGAKV